MGGAVHAQTWTSAFGVGSAPGESTRGVATDASGNTYYVGQFGGTLNFDPAGTPAGQLTAVNSDIVVAKYNANGAFQWAVKGGGSTGDNGVGIATDGTNVYIIGTITGTSATFGSITISTTGGTDIVVAKLSASSGTWLWAKPVGSTVGDAANAICIDGSGNPYILGAYNGSMTLGSTTISPTGGSSSDLFVAKFATADGTPLWLSGGGSTASGDNGNGGGICYVPAPYNEIVVTGSYNATAATYGSLGAIGNSGLNDIIVLEMNASTGAFLSAVNVSTAGEEAGLSITYDVYTQDVVFTGFYDNSEITFGSITLTGGSDDEIYVARYNLDANDFAWAVKPSGGSDVDRGNAITSNGVGLLGLTGQFRGAATFGTTTINSSGAFADLFVAGLSSTDGTWLWAGAAGGGSTTVDDIGRGISTGGPLLRFALAGQFGGTAIFGPFTLTAAGTSSDLLFAQFGAPLAASVSVVNATCANGCDGSATVLATGGVAPYFYSWSPSGGTGATASNLCVGNYTVTITDNAGTIVNKPVVIGLPPTQLASGATSNLTFIVSGNNTNIYDASCNLITKLVPNGANPVSGSVSAKVWIDASVQTYTYPYVQRHYEITPATNAATATGRVTLYFTQAEFNTFNAYPGLIALLPTGPADAARKANVRFTKFTGTSNNNTGAPSSYPQAGTSVIDPADADVVWNATASRWEISFNVVGFSGFFLQTSLFALPVTWLSLNGVLNDAGKATISWKVQEQQVANYSVERSIDGVQYSVIGSLVSQGDGEHSYEWEESIALVGKASYRVKQTDIDGRSTYSKVIHLQSDRRGLVSFYPNPVRITATLNVTDKELIGTTAILYDGTGRALQRILVTQSVTTIYMDKYNKGVYTLRLKGGQSIRIVKE